MHSGLDDEKSIDDRKPLSGAVMVEMMMAVDAQSLPLVTTLMHLILMDVRVTVHGVRVSVPRVISCLYKGPCIQMHGPLYWF